MGRWQDIIHVDGAPAKSKQRDRRDREHTAGEKHQDKKRKTADRHKVKNGSQQSSHQHADGDNRQTG